ncbi:GNAT family N-acetyltransferase [Cellulomonas algicola]|uniref:N-acetyltransferase n=1 Tax=Cellulomonas algicola TaxID=2071633 RepID=A0A401UUY3_9CELL|nr:GNAT family N-acetyltransferase [Cellulomonas algicola]GCD18489.1 N-acetyltransferase [Cellulomonas algicola]
MSPGPADTEPARDDVAVAWRGAFTDDELNALHAEAFDHPPSDDPWNRLVERHSLGWVTARDARGLVGFVNVPWDGRGHAFLEDTSVAARVRRRGVGVRLVEAAREHAAAAGCEWLHVDFEDRLRAFYLDACGFTPTAAGLVRLR